MWLHLDKFNASTHVITEICSLQPAALGLICDMDIVKEAIAKHIGATDVVLGVCAATQPYFIIKPIEGLVACFTLMLVDGEKYDGVDAFIVVWK